MASPSRGLRNVGENSLELGLLRSEETRSRILLVTFAFMALVAGIGAFAVPAGADPISRVIHGRFPVLPFFLLSTAFALYEGSLVIGLSFAVRKRMYPAEIVRWAHALLETSLPAVLILVVGPAVGFANVFASPVILMPFLFVMLSILRLSLPLAVFTGAVSAGWNLGITWLVLPGHGLQAVELHGSLLAAAGRSLFYLLGGVVAGFVAFELKKRLLTSLRLIDDRSRITGLFGQYLSPRVVDRLLAQPVTLGGETQHVTVLFFDIRDFTRFSEARSPEAVIDYLNRIFAVMIEIVNRREGFVNKFLGDGFMAVFGAPLPGTKDARNAVAAAVDMVKALEGLNATAGFPPTRIGIGIHAGEAMTGNVGSEERKEYTVIGDVVNLASRVEQLTKNLAATILVTGEVMSLVEPLPFAVRLPDQFVKGREGAVEIWKLG